MTVCPKCAYTRQPHDANPDWQCPACGVAYAKVAEARGLDSGTKSASTAVAAEPGGLPWIRAALLVGAVWGGWAGFQAVGHQHIGASAGSVVPHAGDLSIEQIHALATTVRAEEVVMYSTSECPYCAQAKAWLNRYGFAFTECNMSLEPRCEQEFRAYGADGTPYLVVRGHHMKDGFDSDEFLAALRR